MLSAFLKQRVSEEFVGTRKCSQGTKMQIFVHKYCYSGACIAYWAFFSSQFCENYTDPSCRTTGRKITSLNVQVSDFILQEQWVIRSSCFRRNAREVGNTIEVGVSEENF